MYAYIKGLIIEKELDSLIVENNGIGYRIMTASTLVDRFPLAGKNVKVFTYYLVREDQLTLYGFSTKEELHLFELLLTVSGIGPKVACNIVGGMDPGQFALAIVMGDLKALTTLKGIGKKSAERLVLELKDKLKGKNLPAFNSTEASNDDSVQLSGVEAGNTVTEAINALMVLGYSSTQAMEAVKIVAKPDLPIEDLIKLALRQLSK